MEKVIGVADTRAHLRDVLDGVSRGTRYLIVQRSKPMAVLMSPEEVETLEVLADRELIRQLIEAKADINAGRYVTSASYFGRKSRARRRVR